MPRCERYHVITYRVCAVRLAGRGEHPFLCRQFGISPATGYKWLQRWAEEGASGLQDRSRAPHHSPNRSSDDITALLRMAHDRHQRWGARKIKRWLEDQGTVCPPSAPSII